MPGPDGLSEASVCASQIAACGFGERIYRARANGFVFANAGQHGWSITLDIRPDPVKKSRACRSKLELTVPFWTRRRIAAAKRFSRPRRHARTPLRPMRYSADTPNPLAATEDVRA